MFVDEVADIKVDRERPIVVRVGVSSEAPARNESRKESHRAEARARSTEANERPDTVEETRSKGSGRSDAPVSARGSSARATELRSSTHTVDDVLGKSDKSYFLSVRCRHSSGPVTAGVRAMLLPRR